MDKVVVLTLCSCKHDYGILHLNMIVLKLISGVPICPEYRSVRSADLSGVPICPEYRADPRISCKKQYVKPISI